MYMRFTMLDVLGQPPAGTAHFHGEKKLFMDIISFSAPRGELLLLIYRRYHGDREWLLAFIS